MQLTIDSELKEYVRRQLLANNGNVKKTARMTGVAQSTVRRWRDEFGIPRLDAGGRRRATDAQRAESFWSKVDKFSSPIGCWIWQGAQYTNGYGRTSFHGETPSAHRYAFESVHGPLNGRQLHHVCANRLCVNPAHLLPVEGPSAHARLEKLEKAFIADAHALAMEAALAPA